MTSPSNAEIRAAIERLILKNKPVTYVNTADLTKTIDDLAQLFQAREQQLLTELMAAKAYHRCEGGWFEYVPAEVIEKYREGL